MIKMSCFTFGQIEIASKDFRKQRQMTGILTTVVNKVVISDAVSCSDGKERVVNYKL